MKDIEEIITGACSDFLNDVVKRQWYGREHEAVSLFAFGHLLRYVKQGTVLYDPTQIVIEGAIGQILKSETKTNKMHVNKDLLIWDSPFKTCWNHEHEPSCVPLVVMEWKWSSPVTRSKRNKLSNSSHDHEFLETFSKLNINSLGFSMDAIFNKTANINT